MRLLALVLTLAAQAAPAPATFEVASVKPHDPANPRVMMVADASGRFTAVGISLMSAVGCLSATVVGCPAVAGAS